MVRAVWAFVLIFVCSAAFAHASAPTLDVLNLESEETIRVDGRLDEAAWSRAPVTDGFTQSDPAEGVAPTEATEVRVLYDRSTLYIGVRCFDSQPDLILRRILQRNRVMAKHPIEGLRFGGDDAIAILLDPFDDNRNGVVFVTNPNGAKADALITDEGAEYNTDWRGIWDVAARVDDRGWTAEFAIPLRSLRYPQEGGRPWGLNIYRVIRRKNEEVLWASWTRETGFTRVSQAGSLRGLQDLPRAGANVEITPYVLGGVTWEEDEDTGRIDRDPEFDVGANAKYEVRPGLVLDLTVNPDFAQVEVDEQQVNLTRFSLFFPEKREFFLENAGIFQFGFQAPFEPPPFLLFFSRQIGIHDDGPVPVLGGARLTGRVGRQTVGFMNTTTDDAFDEPRTNFAVGRIKRDLGSSSYLGVIGTDRRNRHTHNTTFGADFGFWPTPAWNVTGFVAQTITRGPGGDDVAWRLNADFTADRHGFNGGILSVGPEAVADMGFITREDIRRSDAFYRHTRRPGRLGIRSISFLNFAQHISRVDGELQDWMVGPAINATFDSGDDIGVWANRSFTRLDESFELTDDIEILPGDFDHWQVGYWGGTSGNRMASLNSMGSYERFYDGDRVAVSGGLHLAPGSNLSINTSVNFNDVSVPAGSFRATVLGLRAGYAFSTRLFLNSLVQWNTFDDVVSANVRLQYIHRPGNEVFLVFNEEREERATGWELMNRAAVVKLNYLQRF